VASCVRTTCRTAWLYSTTRTAVSASCTLTPRTSTTCDQAPTQTSTSLSSATPPVNRRSNSTLAVLPHYDFLFLLSRAEGNVRHRQNKEASLIWSRHGKTRESSGERDNARNNARCTQARKATHGLDGQHQDVDRTPRGRVSQNDRGQR